MALETMGDATHEAGTREAMTVASSDAESPWMELAREHSDASETRVLTVTFPQRIWFRLDRFMRCEGGWPLEDVLLDWVEHMEEVEREHNERRW